MMSSSVLLSNKTLMNKYLWMSRHLRNFNDAGSIINWANAMLLVKSLLIDHLPTIPVADNLQTSSQQSPPQPHTHYAVTANNSQRSHLERSITPPSTICFHPLEKKSLTKSPPYCSNFVPTEPTHLTIYTHSQPTISPTNSLVPSPKRRKMTIPPAVDYYASTTKISSQPAPTFRKPSPTAKIFSPPSLPEARFHVWYENGARYYENCHTCEVTWVVPKMAIFVRGDPEYKPMPPR